MRKLIFTLALAFLFAPSAWATFNDVATTHDNYTAINYLEKEGIIKGYPDGTFQPNNTINRAEMMKILVEGQGITPDSTRYKNCFPDVTTEWFARYVCYAKEKNWVGGYPDKTFKPANKVLDVEALKMILNAKGVELDPTFPSLIFAGVEMNAWYRPYLVTAEKLNLTGTFLPGSFYSRGEVSEVIFRTLIIEKANVSSYSVEAQNQVFNAEIEKPAALYESASYIDYSPAKRAELEGTRPFAIFFYLNTNPVCQAISNELTANLKDYPDGVMILKANYNAYPALEDEFKVTNHHWFVIFDANGNVTFSNQLFNATDLLNKIIETL